MKPATRHEGLVHETVELPEMGDLFDVAILGPDPGVREDSVSFQSQGQGVSVTFRFTRDQARRIGELLIQAADDGPVRS